MQIIDELEPVARGPYTGSIGYLANSGDLDLQHHHPHLRYQGRYRACSGRGRDRSRLGPRRASMQETLQKAEALRKALGEAVACRFLIATFDSLRYSIKRLGKGARVCSLLSLYCRACRGIRDLSRLRFQGGFNFVSAGNESGKTSSVDTMVRLLFPTNQPGAIDGLVSRQTPEASRAALVAFADDKTYYRVIQDFSRSAASTFPNTIQQPRTLPCCTRTGTAPSSSWQN